MPGLSAALARAWPPFVPIVGLPSLLAFSRYGAVLAAALLVDSP